MSQIENLINRLDKVKGRNGNWTACCPAHSDRSPSLAIRLLEDERILLHCFAGCDVNEIVQSLGMTISDLFPPKTENFEDSKPIKINTQKFFATDLLRIMSFESMVVMIAASDLSKGKKLNERDMDRMKLSFERIQEVARYAGV
jgi:hypothetical protein